MPATECPHCGTHSNLTYRWSGLAKSQRTRAVDVAYTCDQCERLLSARLWGEAANRYDPSKVQRSVEESSRNGRMDWLPPRMHVVVPEGAPPEITAAAEEAHRSLAVGNVRAAILMARSALEACAKDQGHHNGKLVAKIQAMREDGLLTRVIYEAASEIRVWGNDMAHGDFGEEVDAADAKELLALLNAVIEALYAHHARLEGLRQSRESR